MRHVFLELLELHPRLLDSLLRLLDNGLGATLLDHIDDEEDENEHQEHEEHEDHRCEHEEHAVQRQLKSSKLHRWPTRNATWEPQVLLR